MGALQRGAIILVRFPFSDLSAWKFRLAFVLADAGRGDSILCQITSQPYCDQRAIELLPDAFAAGELRIRSYVRPAKLFTGNERLFGGIVAQLTDSSTRRIASAVVELIQMP